MSLSASSAGTALASAPKGAQNAPIFGPFFEKTPAELILCEGDGGELTPKTFGSAVLNTPGDELTLTGVVALKRAAPNVTYVVWAIQSFGPYCSSTSVATIATNRKGNGQVHIKTERVQGPTQFSVYLLREVAAEDFERYGSPAVELD
jgi:hypothetical protein